ncbi:MAG TPA: hypothetical protein VEX15_02010 [Nocardioidaceae bacterium]|nr:hypothetical protein [Nocardioidaceae bacterium]
MTGTDHLPPERELPPRRRDEILRSVLNGEESNVMGRQRIRWITPIAAAAAAALIAVGAVALTGGDDRTGGQRPPVSTTPADNTVSLDLRSLTRAELREELRTAGVEPDYFSAIHYTRWMDGPRQSLPFIVATLPDRQRLFIKMGDLRSVEDKVTPTPTHPILRIEGLDRPRYLAKAVYDHTSRYWKVAGFYRVARTVDRVEVRVGTPDGPEPWRSSPVHGGYVWWATWFKAADYESGAELTLKWRAYDTDGERINPDLMPHQPRTVTVP